MLQFDRMWEGHRSMHKFYPLRGLFLSFQKKKFTSKILCKLFCGVFEITETLIVCENITEINVLVKNLNYRCCSLNNCTVLFSKGLARGGGYL